MLSVNTGCGRYRTIIDNDWLWFLLMVIAKDKIKENWWNWNLKGILEFEGIIAKIFSTTLRD